MKQVILFGSFARGDAHQGSGLDLCIVADSELPWLDRVLDFKERLEAEDLEVVPYVYTPREFELLRQRESPLTGRILEEGRVLYEQQ